MGIIKVGIVGWVLLQCCQTTSLPSSSLAGLNRTHPDRRTFSRPDFSTNRALASAPNKISKKMMMKMMMMIMLMMIMKMMIRMTITRRRRERKEKKIFYKRNLLFIHLC